MPNTTVADWLGRKPVKGDVGLELEVEADEQLPEISTQHWITKTEGSLRGTSEGKAKEYVSNGVLANEDVPRAIRFLSGRLEEPSLKVKTNSPRTSFHVHCNVLGYTPVAVWTSASAYWLCENLLFSQCGRSRKGNLFCLRLSDAEGVIGSCLRDLRREAPFHFLGSDNVRYAGQNLGAVSKFGSLEYRGMEGTTDSGRLTEWAANLHLLTQNASSKYGNPAQMLDSYYALGRSAFLDSLFSPEFASKLKYRGYEEEMEENEGILCELCYFHSWEDWEKKLAVQFASRKNSAQNFEASIEAYSRDILGRFVRGVQARAAPPNSMNESQTTAAPTPRGTSFWATSDTINVTIQGSSTNGR